MKLFILKWNNGSKRFTKLGELSRLLVGSRQTVRKNSIPKKHKPIIDELIQAMDIVLSQLPDKAEKAVAKNKNIHNG